MSITTAVSMSPVDSRPDQGSPSSSSSSLPYPARPPSAVALLVWLIFDFVFGTAAGTTLDPEILMIAAFPLPTRLISLGIDADADADAGAKSNGLYLSTVFLLNVVDKSPTLFQLDTAVEAGRVDLLALARSYSSSASPGSSLTSPFPIPPNSKPYLSLTSSSTRNLSRSTRFSSLSRCRKCWDMVYGSEVCL
jgi:hypothetical protein